MKHKFPAIILRPWRRLNSFLRYLAAAAAATRWWQKFMQNIPVEEILFCSSDLERCWVGGPSVGRGGRRWGVVQQEDDRRVKSHATVSETCKQSAVVVLLMKMSIRLSSDQPLTYLELRHWVIRCWMACCGWRQSQWFIFRVALSWLFEKLIRLCVRDGLVIDMFRLLAG